jgi:uncharacterized protein YceK
MPRITTFIALLLCLCLSGCTSISITDYTEEKPKLDLSTYFKGKVDGWGMVQDRSGKVTRRFTVEMDCTWRGNEGVLDESFVWSDGKTEKRIWKITKQGDNYIGTAGDVVGQAIGVASGAALQWRYVLDLPVDNTTYKVNMDDWMYLIDNNTVSNRTVMTKFGVQLAEISIFFRKRGA